MIHTKRSHEGYLLIDHTASPGTGSLAAIPSTTRKNVPIVPEGKKLEANIITCAHCQRGVILNPQRSHDREWCWGCNHYLCDNCGLVRKIDGQCHNMQQLLDKLQEQAFWTAQRTSAEGWLQRWQTADNSDYTVNNTAAKELTHG